MLVILYMVIYIILMNRQTLTPEMETVIDMMSRLPRERQERIMNAMYDMVAEIESEEKWNTMLNEHSGPMEDMAAQALREHHEKKTRPMR